MATVIRAYGSDYTLYAKDTDDLAQFVEEGGLIPVYDGIDDFTVSRMPISVSLPSTTVWTASTAPKMT